ncbi:MAG TPA: hypothetical protein VE172_23455 [Stackebrandtia sp.]|uniref:hypothetical protein n=1 Tax=Stackebrandtia sp. TaxID=2023065 RepID=UPI002D61D071|nr:hypothetical protein [Stackebrandtia sp.]HZE41767.1 hypothetical protein [Stackebrandtia sp.]
MSSDHGDLPPDDNGGDDNDHTDASRRDMLAARETLDRVRREMPFRKALWGFRLYYIGVLSSVGAALVTCFGGPDAAIVVIPVGLPLGVAGYLYGYLLLKSELRAFMADASSEVWHSRRDRKNVWQLSILRDSFMGRLRDEP